MKRFASIVLLQIALLFVGLAISVLRFGLRLVERLALRARRRLVEIRRSRIRLVWTDEVRTDPKLRDLKAVREREAFRAIAAASRSRRLRSQGSLEDARTWARRAFQHWKAERLYGRWMRAVEEEAA